MRYQAFFNQDPKSFPQFVPMLTSYWALRDLFIEILDDPIIFSVASSPDGSQIATLSESGPDYLRLVDATTGEKLHEVELGLDGMVMATTLGNLDHSPHRSHVVAAYTNPVVRVIDTQTGEVTLEIEHSQLAHSAAFSPKEVCAMDESIAAFLSGLDQAASSRDIERYMALFSPRRDVLFVYNGEVLVGAEAIAKTHWDSWSQLASLEFHTGPVLALQMGPDCAVLTAAGHSSRTYRSGESFDGEYVLTLGLERYDTGWRIRQKHESIPPGSHRPLSVG